jgi:hypothetical protein
MGCAHPGHHHRDEQGGQYEGTGEVWAAAGVGSASALTKPSENDDSRRQVQESGGRAGRASVLVAGTNWASPEVV